MRAARSSAFGRVRFGTGRTRSRIAPTPYAKASAAAQDHVRRKKRSRQRTGLTLAIQWISESCRSMPMAWTASGVQPSVPASASRAVGVHHVRWWGGALMTKFGMVVLGEGQSGVPIRTTPPGLTQAASALAKPSESATCSITWNAQATS